MSLVKRGCLLVGPVGTGGGTARWGGGTGVEER